tara:strand:- start:1276 stop:2106 length:831 start_codon:yes stop_codon:yes gene_type:complete
MAHTEPAPIRLLGEADVSAALELSREANWNQTASDWMLFIRNGSVSGLEHDGILAATAAIMPYGDDRGWIGMVLTRKAHRGKGFGTAMLKHCLAALEAQGRAALLDATPAGEPLYRALGFKGMWSSTRWRGQVARTAQGRPAAVFSEARRQAVARDGAAFGVERETLLSDFAARVPEVFQVVNDAVCFGRNGDRATQIGPLACRDEAAGLKLLETALQQIDGTVILDIPDSAEATVAYIEEKGFARERPFLRMIKGQCANHDSDWRHIAIAGPEFG